MSSNQRTSDATSVAVLAAVRSGSSNREAAALHGIDEATVRRIRLRDRLAHNTEPTVVHLDKKVGGFDWRKALPIMESIQGLRRDASWSQRSATIKVGDGKNPIGLMILGDTHIGSVGTDYRLFLELTDLIINTPNLVVALLGDTVDFAIKLRSVAEVCAQILDPSMQLEFIESWIDEIKHKVVFCTWGNHESDRSEAALGACPVKNILARHAPYFSGIGHAHLQVGTQTYKIATSHKFAGITGLDSTAGCKKYLRMEWPEGDAAIQGDCHRTGVSVYNEGASHHVAISCGTLQVRSTFAERYFSLATSSSFPVLTMWPDKKQMVPFFNVQQFMDTLGMKPDAV